jgi:2-oxo-3-hexenedioate decarboxylase
MSDALHTTLATELLAAYRDRTLVAPPSTREGGLDLNGAYAVESEIARIRQAAGHRVAGLKVGFANKAMWRALKLETLVWGRMYDDTVEFAKDDSAMLDMAGMLAPKIEPEIVFRLSRPLSDGDTGAEAVLDAVEWLALGFEIIDCVFPDWTFTPVDFVAAKGLHTRLVVGSPLVVSGPDREALASALATFTVRLERHGALLAEGSGRNSLRSPALCLGELGAALRRRGEAGTLGAAALVSSGTLTESQRIQPGDTWTARVDGLPLPPLRLRVVQT